MIKPGVCQATLEKLLKTGKKVGCYFGTPEQLNDLATQQGCRFLKNVTGLNTELQRLNLGFASFVPLLQVGSKTVHFPSGSPAELKQLRSLNLGSTKISEEGLGRVEGMSRLQQLNLDHTKVTDVGLTRLKGLTELESLLIGNTSVTDVGLVHLKGLSGLKALYLGGAKVTDQWIAEIRKTLPKLQVFH